MVKRLRDEHNIDVKAGQDDRRCNTSMTLFRYIGPHIGIMEKNMETTMISGYIGFRV